MRPRNSAVPPVGRSKRAGWTSGERGRNLLRLTQISDPVPGKQALDAHHHVRPKRRQRLQKELLVGRNLRALDDVTGLVENADRQEPGVQIDAAVESVLSCVKSHHGLRVRDVRRSCGNYQHTSCEEAMMSIKALQQTAGACRLSVTCSSLGPRRC